MKQMEKSPSLLFITLDSEFKSQLSAKNLVIQSSSTFKIIVFSQSLCSVVIECSQSADWSELWHLMHRLFSVNLDFKLCFVCSVKIKLHSTQETR